MAAVGMTMEMSLRIGKQVPHFVRNDKRLSEGMTSAEVRELQALQRRNYKRGRENVVC
jgi:hypothetical protein